MLSTEAATTTTTMQVAFANATPVAQPHIYLITRSKSGLRIWFEDNSTAGRYFVWSLAKNILTIEEDSQGSRVIDRIKSGEVVNTRLGGAKIRMPVHIAPSWSAGKLVYEIPDIPELNPRLLGKPRIPTQRDQVSRMKHILTLIREVEVNSAYRVSHDSKTGLAIFLARIEP